ATGGRGGDPGAAVDGGVSGTPRRRTRGGTGWTVAIHAACAGTAASGAGHGTGTGRAGLVRCRGRLGRVSAWPRHGGPLGVLFRRRGPDPRTRRGTPTLRGARAVQGHDRLPLPGTESGRRRGGAHD